jgi:MoaA/NifB/PqqE/SkfB family radical SAM enzyme
MDSVSGRTTTGSSAPSPEVIRHHEPKTELRGPWKQVWLWIDPTRRCNISCRLCYARPSHGPDDLKPQTFCEILDSLTASNSLTIRELTLNWRGEPLMNPAFESLLEILRTRRVKFPLQFHTNCTLLTPDRAAKIVESIGSMPLRIYLSIDGGSEASHDANRGRGTFQRAVTGAMNLIRARGSRANLQLILYDDVARAIQRPDPSRAREVRERQLHR